MSINNGTMNRIGAGGTLNTFGSVQTVDKTKIQELTEAIDSATESIQEGKSAIDNTVQTGLDTISASGQIVLQTINNTATTVTDTLNNTVQEAVQTVSDEVDNAKQEISTAATTVVQYDVPVICPKEDVGCVLIKNAELGETETIEVHRPTGESVHYTGKPIDFSQFVNVGIVSDEYNPSKPYIVGEYCIYLKERYKCIANTTAGILPTNTTYFVKTRIDDEFSELNSKVPFELAIDSDGNYGYKKVGADTVTPFKSGGGAEMYDAVPGIQSTDCIVKLKIIFPTSRLQPYFGIIMPTYTNHAYVRQVASEVKPWVSTEYPLTNYSYYELEFPGAYLPGVSSTTSQRCLELSNVANTTQTITTNLNLGVGTTAHNEGTYFVNPYKGTSYQSSMGNVCYEVSKVKGTVTKATLQYLSTSYLSRTVTLSSVKKVWIFPNQLTVKNTYPTGYATIEDGVLTFSNFVYYPSGSGKTIDEAVTAVNMSLNGNQLTYSAAPGVTPTGNWQFLAIYFTED